MACCVKFCPQTTHISMSIAAIRVLITYLSVVSFNNTQKAIQKDIHVCGICVTT